ncbi:MAG: isoprenylcysteine carboxylmethyltransferase family protein [Vicinamibacterales bacterium]
MRTFLALRALLFLILIPGTVAGYFPLQIVQATTPALKVRFSASSVLSSCLIAVGVFVLLRCVWDFFASGRGTLAPFDPPRSLVVTGLYRFTRNPMYNGVLAVLLGEAWLFRSTSLLQYAAAVFVLFNLVVLVYEEPVLESQFGDSYRAYRRAVPRWGFTARPYAEPGAPS